jgi:hypothetical protein
MSEHWQSYFTNVNSELASIRLDLNLAAHAPMATKPHLLWVWLHFQSPRADGLSSSEESNSLWTIEDALLAKLKVCCGAIHSGCITTLGRREFFLYSEIEEGFPEAVSETFRSFPTYKFDLGSHRDEGWNQYLHVLYPSEDQLDAMGNREVLDRLKEHGDVHELPREVMHLIYFPTDDDRSRFKAAASVNGFDIFDVPDDPDVGSPFSLFVGRVQSVTQDEIDRTTRELRSIAKANGGDYDGWEAQTTTMEQPNSE